MQVVGIDVGGSKTHAISRGSDGGQHEAFTGSANLSSVGEAEAADQLDLVLTRLADRQPEPVEAICAGSAGVDTPEAEARLQRLIQQRVPGAAVRIVHDAHLILAAAGVDTGIALISGTGSVAWGRSADGRTARTGGWGYLLGDEGGGYAIAREAVRHALRLSDHGRPADRLTRRLAADCGLAGSGQLLDHFYATPERRYWAGRARVVFALAADHDPVAQQLVTAAAADLADLVRPIARFLDAVDHLPADPLPVVLGGGVLVHQPLLQVAVREALRAIGLTDVRVLQTDPAAGALLLAEQLAATLSRPTPDPEQRNP